MKQKFLNWLALNRRRAAWLTLYSETTAARFWFGLLSLGYASFLVFSEYAHHPGSSYVLMFKIAAEWVWATAFILNGLALLYGSFTRKYNTFLLLLEGVLGVAVWSAAAAATTIEQGAPGGTTVGALIALWVLVRYPTHHEWEALDNEKCWTR